MPANTTADLDDPAEIPHLHLADRLSRVSPNSAGSARLVLNRREYAVLEAVATGQADIVCTCEPGLIIDGRYCCHQDTAHELARSGLIRASTPSTAPGQIVPAELTPAGAAALQLQE